MRLFWIFFLSSLLFLAYVGADRLAQGHPNVKKLGVEGRSKRQWGWGGYGGFGRGYW
uniref:Uncharacterized protein n=1 Tax=Acrobeloides nanus TaxID=290746 RepID=A0A914DXK8_9BILA